MMNMHRRKFLLGASALATAAAIPQAAKAPAIAQRFATGGVVTGRWTHMMVTGRDAFGHHISEVMRVPAHAKTMEISEQKFATVYTIRPLNEVPAGSTQ